MSSRLISIFLILLFFSIGLRSQDMGAAINGVVLVSSQAPGGSVVETGAGIIVGQRGQELFIITALHVVVNGVDSIQVQLANSTWKSYPAKMYKEFNPLLDLAVIIITVSPEKAAEFTKWRETNFKYFKPNGQIASIGHPSGSDKKWEVIRSETLDVAYENNKIRFRGIGVQGGFSGGALVEVKKQRLMGMIINTQESSVGVAVRMSEIINMLDRWRIPHNLIRPPAKPIPKSTYLFGGLSIGTAFLGNHLNNRGTHWKEEYERFGDEEAAQDILGMSRDEIAKKSNQHFTFRTLSYVASGLLAGAAIWVNVKDKFKKNPTESQTQLKITGQELGLVFTF